MGIDLGHTAILTLETKMADADKDIRALTAKIHGLETAMQKSAKATDAKSQSLFKMTKEIVGVGGKIGFLIGAAKLLTATSGDLTRAWQSFAQSFVIPGDTEQRLKEVNILMREATEIPTKVKTETPLYWRIMGGPAELETVLTGGEQIHAMIELTNKTAQAAKKNLDLIMKGGNEFGNLALINKAAEESIKEQEKTLTAENIQMQRQVALLEASGATEKEITLAKEAQFTKELEIVKLKGKDLDVSNAIAQKETETFLALAKITATMNESVDGIIKRNQEKAKEDYKKRLEMAREFEEKKRDLVLAGHKFQFDTQERMREISKRQAEASAEPFVRAAAHVRQQTALSIAAQNEEAENAKRRMDERERAEKKREKAKEKWQKKEAKNMQVMASVHGAALGAMEGALLHFDGESKKSQQIAAGLQATKLIIDSIMYGAKGVAAFAALNPIEGAGNLVAAAVSASGAAKIIKDFDGITDKRAKKEEKPEVPRHRVNAQNATVDARENITFPDKNRNGGGGSNNGDVVVYIDREKVAKATKKHKQNQGAFGNQ